MMKSPLHTCLPKLAAFRDTIIDMFPKTDAERQVDFAKKQSEALTFGLTSNNRRPSLDEIKNRPKMPKRHI